jgi:hypothetical protein
MATTLATETWTGADGAAWPAQWVAAGTGANSSATLVDNTGQISAGSTGYYAFGQFLNGMIPTTDFDITVDVGLTGALEQYHTVGWGTSAALNNDFSSLPAVGYAVSVRAGTCAVYRGADAVSLSGEIAFTFTAGVRVNVQFTKTGSLLSAWVWSVGQTKPVSPQWSGSDATVGGSGKVLLACGNGGGAAPVTYDNLTVLGPDPTAAVFVRSVGGHTLVAAAVTPLAPGVPAGVTATDLSILTVEGKRTTNTTAPTVTTPTGWTLIATTHAAGVTAGVDTGSNSVSTFYRTGTYTGPSITTTGFNSAGAVIVAYQTQGNGWVTPVTSTNGSDTTSGANGSITGAAGLSVQQYDLVQASVGLSGDAGTVTAQTIAGMTGATLSATTERVNFAVTTGNDVRTLVADCQVTAGTSNVAPTYAYTNASALTSHGQFLRLRANPPATTAAAPFRRIGKRVY